MPPAIPPRSAQESSALAQAVALLEERAPEALGATRRLREALECSVKREAVEKKRANDERDAAREQLRMQMEAEQREQDRAAEMQKALIAAAAQIQMAQMKTPEAETPMDQAAILMSLQQTMQALQESISRPRVVVRGPDNRIVGVQ